MGFRRKNGTPIDSSCPTNKFFSRVLYVSIHRYENGDFWPNLKQGDFNYVGSGEGYGYNFNIPLNETGMTDVDYLTIFHRVILPIAHEVSHLQISNPI